MDDNVTAPRQRRGRGGNYTSRPVVTPIGRVYALSDTYLDAQSCRREAEALLEMADRLEDGASGRLLVRRARQLLIEAGVHERAVQRWFMRELAGAIDGPDLVA